MIKEIMIAGCGGFIGTAGRYIINRLTAQFWHDSFPLATFLVNITGCFLIGLFLGMLENTKILSPSHNLLLITGFCGGFTTFSTFANELWTLGSKDDWTVGILYLTFSIAGGILCVCAGRALIR